LFDNLSANPNPYLIISQAQAALTSGPPLAPWMKTWYKKVLRA